MNFNAWPDWGRRTRRTHGGAGRHSGAAVCSWRSTLNHSSSDIFPRSPNSKAGHLSSLNEGR